VHLVSCNKRIYHWNHKKFGASIYRFPHMKESLQKLSTIWACAFKKFCKPFPRQKGLKNISFKGCQIISLAQPGSMSQAGPGWWIPVKMILQFTARGKENRKFKSSYLRGLCPIRLFGKCQMMVFWVSAPFSTVVFSCVAFTFRVTDFGSSAH